MIEVKQKFINEGKRGSSHQCPVALAFLDATGLKQARRGYRWVTQSLLLLQDKFGNRIRHGAAI